MKPENQSARKVAFGNFLGVYSVAIVIPVIAAYFLFHTPNHAITEENRQLRATVEEQQKLLARLSGMEKQAISIKEADQSYLNETNEVAKANLFKQMEERENELKDLLREAKRDSLAFTAPVNRSISASIARSFDVFLTYRNLITPLRQALEQKGGCCTDVQQLNTDLKAAQDKIDLMQLVKNNAPPANPGGGGGGDSKKDEEIARLTGEAKKHAADIAKYEQQLAQKCPDAPVVTTSPNVAAIESLQTQIAYERAECLLGKANLTKQLSERRKLYEQALKSFENIYRTTKQDEFKTKSNRRMEEIKKQIADW